MNQRILKKLCKRAAEYVTDCVLSEDFLGNSILGVWYKTGYWEEEWEFSNSWEILSDRYFDAYIEYSEDGIKYTGKKATPTNVFKWAKNGRT